MADGYDRLRWYYKIAYQEEYEVNTPQYVGWYDKKHQFKRFDQLLNIGVKDGHWVLDYGCGVGDLLGYMREKGRKNKYFGLDINEDYLTLAKKTYPGVMFYNGDVTDISPTSIKLDWILASGVFNVLVPQEWMMTRIAVATRLVKRGFAFNLLSKSEDITQLAEYDPKTIKAQLIEEYPAFDIDIVEGYLEDDFTVYMRRKIILI